MRPTRRGFIKTSLGITGHIAAPVKTLPLAGSVLQAQATAVPLEVGEDAISHFAHFWKVGTSLGAHFAGHIKPENWSQERIVKEFLEHAIPLYKYHYFIQKGGSPDQIFEERARRGTRVWKGELEHFGPVDLLSFKKVCAQLSKVDLPALMEDLEQQTLKALAAIIEKQPSEKHCAFDPNVIYLKLGDPDCAFTPELRIPNAAQFIDFTPHDLRFVGSTFTFLSHGFMPQFHEHSEEHLKTLERLQVHLVGRMIAARPSSSTCYSISWPYTDEPKELDGLSTHSGFLERTPEHRMFFGLLDNGVESPHVLAKEMFDSLGGPYSCFFGCPLNEVLGKEGLNTPEDLIKYFRHRYENPDEVRSKSTTLPTGQIARLIEEPVSTLETSAPFSIANLELTATEPMQKLVQAVTSAETSVDTELSGDAAKQEKPTDLKEPMEVSANIIPKPVGHFSQTL